jgi:hypothetical protein
MAKPNKIRIKTPPDRLAPALGENIWGPYSFKQVIKAVRHRYQPKNSLKLILAAANLRQHRRRIPEARG